MENFSGEFFGHQVTILWYLSQDLLKQRNNFLQLGKVGGIFTFLPITENNNGFGLITIDIFEKTTRSEQ